MKNEKNIFDVAIIGGGNAGMSAALIMTRAMLDCCLINDDRKYNGNVIINN